MLVIKHGLFSFARIILIHFERRHQFKGGDLHFKRCCVFKLYHLKGSVHFADIRHYWAPRSVLMAFTWFEHWL